MRSIARYCHDELSVRLFVTLVDCDEMRWNCSKIISRLISLTILFSVDPSITFCSIDLSRCFHSRIFHPCKIVPIFLLLHFPPLQNRADVSTPAFSTLAKSCRCFHSRLFHPCIFDRADFPTPAFSVTPYRGTAVPFFHGTSTVAYTVLFSTAIPQIPRFFGTVLVRC